MQRPTILRAATGLPAQFWWLFGGVAVMALATFVFPFLALFLRSRGYSPGATGLVVALFGAGSIPAGPLAGWAADRFGRRPTLLVSLTSAAVLTAMLPLISSAAGLAVTTLALGLAVHAYWPASNALVADVLPPERYSDAYGLMYWERNAGIAFSFAIGGTVAATGFAPLFFADAATTLLFAALVWAKIRESAPAAVGQASGDRGFSTALRDGRFVALLALTVAFFLVMFQFMVAVPIAMTDQGFSAAAYGRAMMVNGVLIVLLQPLSGWALRRYKAGHVLAFAAMLVALGYGGYAICREPWHYAIATGVWSLGEILTLPTLSSLTALIAPADLRGRYQGLLGLSFGAGLALAPAIGGIALEQLGAQTLWICCAVVALAVGGGQLLAGRARGETGPI